MSQTSREEGYLVVQYDASNRLKIICFSESKDEAESEAEKLAEDCDLAAYVILATKFGEGI